MCGITGIIAFSEEGKKSFDSLRDANRCLSQRGPDNEGFYTSPDVVFGHRRLSIIDVSEAANQPMHDASGRYVIIFNGEFFNYHTHRDELMKRGETFTTTSDTEVLLRLYMLEGPKFLEKINGFFALAIHDKQTNAVFIARDRMGIKPLFYYYDRERLVFASELKALMKMNIPRKPDHISIYNYFQLNYIPGPWTIFENVKKLKPGHYLELNSSNGPSSVTETPFYRIPAYSELAPVPRYEVAMEQLKMHLQNSVEKRMIADVPLGAFLSGGIDSSVIVALASGFTSHLNTFSIGYKDEPMYDETNYALLVAKKYNTNHHVFSLSNDDLYGNLFSVLDYIDEPFADSSALAVNILSMHTRRHVVVSLSGDGADELFGGYNKHRAEWIIRNRMLLTGGLKVAAPFLSSFEGARNSPLANKIRQIHRFAEGASMSPQDRYWRWCGFAGEKDVESLLKHLPARTDYNSRKKDILMPLGSGDSVNDVLHMDMHMVLPNDMLVKVDMMSMAHSLEVRVPFLDYEVVNFASSLPSSYKIDRHTSKKILRDAFRNELPVELYNRPKHGFEVPLLKWLRNDLKSMITDDLLSNQFIEQQGIFNREAVDNLKSRLFSNNPGDIESRMWGLIVFQHWWKKYMD